MQITSRLFYFLSKLEYYRNGRIAVFVDGPPHDRADVQVIDAGTRRRLKRLNYRPLIIRYDDLETGLNELARRLAL